MKCRKCGSSYPGFMMQNGVCDGCFAVLPLAEMATLGILPEGIEVPTSGRESAAVPGDAYASARDMEPGLFSFKGRIARGQYWGTLIALSLVSVLVALAQSGVEAIVTSDSGIGLLILGVLMTLGAVALAISLTWLGFANQVKRCHDRGMPGSMALVTIIPVVGWLWAFVELGCLRGTTGVNEYGADPCGT